MKKIVGVLAALIMSIGGLTFASTAPASALGAFNFIHKNDAGLSYSIDIRCFNSNSGTGTYQTSVPENRAHYCNYGIHSMWVRQGTKIKCWDNDGNPSYWYANSSSGKWAEVHSVMFRLRAGCVTQGA